MSMTTAYSLATIRHDGRPTPVMEVGGHYWLLDGVAPGLIDKASGSGLIKLFDDWPVSHAKLSAIAQTLQGSASELRSPKGAGDFYEPLLYPAKLIMMGANYADHVAKDVGIQGFNKVANIPTLFMKPPTTALIGGGLSVPYPQQTKALDWEVELAVIRGAPTLTGLPGSAA